ncbi:hypothetical protein SDC9_186114 [bioreactor metagenome]|uniref:Uncharacterized protein n=1 Tax=bioreactor metagenome TaxID=1076179 RepID=A0A645HIM0_9ZZZZ
MQQLERQPPRIERLARQVNQHAGILADGIEQDRALELADRVAENLNALRLKLAELA